MTDREVSEDSHVARAKAGNCVKAIVSAALLGLLSAAASGATLQLSDSGTLLGATGVVIDRYTYSVEFVDGTCIARFAGCDSPQDFDFSRIDRAYATSAAQALLDQVLLDTPQGQFDSLPQLTNGCVFSNFCLLYIPVALMEGGSTGNGPAEVTSSAAANYSAGFSEESGSEDVVFPFVSLGRDTDTAEMSYFGDSVTYAVFHRRDSLVAAPETAALLVLGLAAMAFIRRRRTSIDARADDEACGPVESRPRSDVR